ncbi:MAG: NAD(P)/FAD-dependent oxidoreductase [Burkholderiales bacterium]|nr:NAD(P)/FAD-dependent oxidoreductase [Flavobacterium sp.]
MKTYEVIIIGGGLAGLTAAIHLAKIGIQVTVVEKNSYPKHKVCGEYISNEVLPYLQWLDINVSDIKPTNIDKIIFSTANGKVIKGNLPLGGFGISRFALDEFLFRKAIESGCQFVEETVESIAFDNDEFAVTTVQQTILKSKILIGAYGKRSNIDQQLHRNFLTKKSPWLAVKSHYIGDFPDDSVGLHNFKGGYCGISKVENNLINICYLADYKTFKNYKNIEDYQDKVVSKNPQLKTIFDNVTPVFDKPLTISQISFEKKDAVENHILMIGDSVGLIHPLCGNGMAMAVHSAKIVSELVQKFYNKELSRAALEQQYRATWDFNFNSRLGIGRVLARILSKPKLSEQLLRIVTLFPSLLPKIIAKTHGKPIILNS